ncbi:RNA 3'-terminal phosphate cyclase [Achlya hypogyna]|uniref:RNA 3'-terminal phosphate cyclase n=1 Tax=Achlya hypogyna TaxID=1202772 RepID=A0A1V9ZH66_ACHHY|nr:RNA 3'-terminal phosphate cyclase [Achlya hypogyna]
MPHIVDIGLNLAHGQFRKDLWTVLDRAVKAGVTTLVATGTDLKASAATIALIRRIQKRDLGLQLACTVGVHPHNAGASPESLVAELRAMIVANRDIAVAVGECGLDFNRDFSPRDAQIRVFRAQVELACELGLPLFCHERDAHASFLSVLMPFLETGRLRSDRVVVHCFTGSERELHAYVGLGFYLGVTGFVAMPQRGRHLRPLLSRIPRDRLLVETDAPFMHPSQKRTRCEPSDIHTVLETIATATGTTPALRTAPSAQLPPAPPLPPTRPPAPVSIDGSLFEGGGQILRLAAPLAVLNNTPVIVHSIRANRPKPGLARQHLGGLELAAAISGADFEGLELLSTQVSVRPRAAPRTSAYVKDLHGAGSLSLVLQGVLPLLVRASETVPTVLTLRGGTHVPFSPPMDFWCSGLSLLLARMGITLSIETRACGFMPLGRGHVIVTVPPVGPAGIQPLQLATRSREPSRVQSQIVVYGTGDAVGAAMECHDILVAGIHERFGVFPPFESAVTVQSFKAKGGLRIALHVTLELTHGNVLTGSCIQAATAADAVADVVAEIDRVWTTDACVDEHLADNLLVYMALASGPSLLRVPLNTSSQHIEAAMHVISAITRVPFNVTEDGASRLVECPGQSQETERRHL